MDQHINNKKKNKEIKKYCRISYNDWRNDSSEKETEFNKSFPFAILKLFFPKDLTNDHDIDRAIENLQNNDAGIDAHFTKDNDTHIICQFKTVENYNKPIQKTDLSYLNDVEQRLKSLKEHKNYRVKEIIKEVEGVETKNINKYFFTNSFYNLDNLKQEFNNLKIINGEEIYKAIQDDENINNDEVLSECEIEFVTPENRNNGSNYEDKVISFYAPIRGKETSIGLISGKEIIHLMDQYSNRLFARNVRYFLEKSSVNKGMIETVKDKPKNFYYYNNGVTITCEKMEKAGNNKLKLIKPQVINGAQTFHSIYNAYKENKEINMADVKVLAVIIKSTITEEADFTKNLTKFRNANNSILDSDYKANDPIQKKLQQEFYKLGYFYEIKRGERDYCKKKKTEHSNIEDFQWKSQFNTKEKFIDQKNLASLWCAYNLQNPTTAKMSPKSIFTEEVNSVSSNADDKTIYKQLFPSKMDITKDIIKKMIFVKILFDTLERIKKLSDKLIKGENLTKDQKELLEICFDRKYTNYMNNTESNDDDFKFPSYVEFLNYSKYHIISACSYIIKFKNINIIDHTPHDSKIIINKILAWVYIILNRVIKASYKNLEKPINFIHYSKKPEFWESIKKHLNDLDNDDWDKLDLR